MKQTVVCVLVAALMLAFSGCVLFDRDASGGLAADENLPQEGENTPDTPEEGENTPTAPEEEKTESRRDNIPWEGDQLYAVAHLGYQEIQELDYFAGLYLDSADVPVHTVSDGDYYLIIPRYDGMTVALYKNDIETSQASLIYETPDAKPFIVQCNVSDVFADLTVRFTRDGETAEFSPFISLENGELDVGERGLELAGKA